MTKKWQVRVAPAVVFRSHLQLAMSHRARRPKLFFRSTVLLSPWYLVTRMRTRRRCRAAADTLRFGLPLPTVHLFRLKDLCPHRLGPTPSSVESQPCCNDGRDGQQPFTH